MSGSIPSFVQPSVKYEDLFKDDDIEMLVAPITATPVSQVPSPSTNKGEGVPTEKRKFTRTAGSPASTPETRSTKRVKGAPAPTVSQEVQAFYKVTGGLVPLETIVGWSRLKGSETANASLQASAQSLFYRLRLEDQLAVAASGDARLREELRKAKVDLKSSEEERKKLTESNKKLKNEVASLSKNKETLSKVIADQDAEKERLVADQAVKMKELQTQVDGLQAAKKGYRYALEDRYKMGFANGVNDYMRSTWLKMPNLDWTLLGEDAVKQVESFKVEAAKSQAAAQKAACTPVEVTKVAEEAIPDSRTETEAPINAVEEAPGNPIDKGDPAEESSIPDAAINS